MVGEKPFIHLFSTPGGYYIYDINANTVLKANKHVHNLLEAEQKNIQNDNSSQNVEADNIITRMRRDGYLSSKRISEIVHSEDEILEDLLDSRLSLLTLQVTQQCNLRCKYCLYSGSYLNRTHSDKRMSEEIAKKSIDFYINRSCNTPELNLGFYGGEPLLEFDFVKKCMEYVEEKAEGKKVRYNITTNGTLLNDGIVECFEKHGVSLMISLDGPREVHDKNRRFAFNDSGTFDVIMRNMDNIKTKYPDYYRSIHFNIVIDPENSFSSINEFFMNFELTKEGNVNSTFVTERYNKNSVRVNEDIIKERGYELFKGLLWQTERLDGSNISSIIKNDFAKEKTAMEIFMKPAKALPDKGHHSGPCVPGAARMFVDINGNLFPCERVSESSEAMKIGSIETGFDIGKIRELINIGKLTEEKCKDCWAFRTCEQCAACADAVTGLSADKKMSMCGIAKYTVEERLKNFCTLSEFGYDFGKGFETYID